jgi:Enoyl-(Acyl carrier protein) reductase
MMVRVGLLGELSAVDEQSNARDEAGPGAIDTPMVADTAAKGRAHRAYAAASTPIARLRQAEEIAASVLWLCSPGASYLVGVALPSMAATPPNDPPTQPSRATGRWISSTAPTVAAMHTQPSPILATQKVAVHATKDTTSDRR